MLIKELEELEIQQVHFLEYNYLIFNFIFPSGGSVWWDGRYIPFEGCLLLYFKMDNKRNKIGGIESLPFRTEDGRVVVGYGKRHGFKDVVLLRGLRKKK